MVNQTHQLVILSHNFITLQTSKALKAHIENGAGLNLAQGKAFDELTTLMNSREYQEMSLERTRLWALRCIAEHQRLTEERVGKPYQALFGVLQGAQYEDLRRKASRDLGAMDFDGFGIGGAL